jgi:hypothetical protein
MASRQPTDEINHCRWQFGTQLPHVGNFPPQMSQCRLPADPPIDGRPPQEQLDQDQAQAIDIALR